MSSINIYDRYEDQRWQHYLHDNEMLVGIARKVLESVGILEGNFEVNILFTNDAEVQLINKKWRNKNAPTNVLSFPFASQQELYTGVRILGDLVFSYDRVLHESLSQNKLFIQHFSHLFVHGLLHLIGYIHTNEEEAHVMESAEIGILSSIGVPNPYQDDV